MPNVACPLKMTSQEYADIQQCEAVVIREYELVDGSRIAMPVAWGDAIDMQDAAKTRGIFIVPPDVEIISQTMVLVRNLPLPIDGDGSE